MRQTPTLWYLLKKEAFFTACDILVFLGLYPRWKHTENMIDFVCKMKRDYPDGDGK